MSKHSGKSQHKTYAETGKVQGNDSSSSKPSPRFYAEGGFVRHGNHAHTTHGAPLGYASKVSGGVKKS